ncbi:3-methylitaconate isomerase [Edwardsiella piscicida]|uniref:2-methylaconitate cis-trans isomerase PrpF family protein n=2 Tax=Edwardsiella piscicida TaxID=1263550 RepID=UPI000D517BE9|nr:PrpF domain-containing protein [Edwardsiella piscicida]ELM3724167.1 3-methylitaconate isomerase [Edwardsiella piscicida]UCQ19753.1 3-methylitaconate isomerase [Edwardsiella piscicida]
MQTETTLFPVSIVRGGTSKGIFIMKNSLPDDEALRDRIILSVFGSPDLRQIDGLGGADPLTSKLAIISPSSRADADIDYIFGQVSITDAFIDYKGNCGNISSAVGCFAIHKGLVQAQEPITTIRIHMVNTGRILIAHVPVKNGMPSVDGELQIDGVPGTAANVELDWADSGGATTGCLLPTGQPYDVIECRDRKYKVSIVDAGNVTVFISSSDLGLQGTETPAEIIADPDRMNLIEEIRGKAAQKIGLVDDWRNAANTIPFAPFFSIVSAPKKHTTFNGRDIDEPDCDIISRLVFMQTMHKAHPVTGTIALGAAARIPGTLVHDILPLHAHQRERLNIGHPSGIIFIDTAVIQEDGGYKLSKSVVNRTARMLLDGYFYLRNSILY